MDDLARDTLTDARWFPLRYDAAGAALHFAFIPAETHRRIAFLNELRPTPAETRVLPRAALRDAQPSHAPMHLILHTGLGGSTLLGRALAQPGVALSLQEPPILTDVIAYGLTHAPDETGSLLGEVTGLLSRPLGAGETVICKVSGIGNGLAPSLAARNPGSQILCLQTPLEEMLSSFASRGLAGRIGARKLLIGIRNARMLAVDMSEKDLAAHTDLQLAALGWISMQKMMLDAAARFGPARVASISSAQLMQDRRRTLTAIAQHFRLDLDVDASLASGVFDRHAKTGEPFDARRRAERMAETLRIHAEEIEPVADWARKLAQAAGIAWDLPYPLLASGGSLGR